MSRVFKVRKVLRESVALRAPPVPKGLKALRESRVFKENRALRVRKALKVSEAPRGLKDHRANKAPKGLRARQAPSPLCLFCRLTPHHPSHKIPAMP